MRDDDFEPWFDQMFRDIRYPRKSARSEKSVFCTNVKLTSVSVLEENIIIVLFLSLPFGIRFRSVSGNARIYGHVDLFY
jgi:hypothetical protein